MSVDNIYLFICVCVQACVCVFLLCEGHCIRSIVFSIEHPNQICKDLNIAPMFCSDA